MNKLHYSSKLDLPTEVGNKRTDFKVLYATVNSYDADELQLEGIQQVKNGKPTFKRKDISWNNVNKTDIIQVKGQTLNYTDIKTTKFNYHTYHFTYKGCIIYANTLLINEVVILDIDDYMKIAEIIDNLKNKYSELKDFTVYHNYKELNFKIGTYNVMIDEMKELKRKIFEKFTNKKNNDI